MEFSIGNSDRRKPEVGEVDEGLLRFIYFINFKFLILPLRARITPRADSIWDRTAGPFTVHGHADDDWSNGTRIADSVLLGGVHLRRHVSGMGIFLKNYGIQFSFSKHFCNTFRFVRRIFYNYNGLEEMIRMRYHGWVGDQIQNLNNLESFFRIYSFLVTQTFYRGFL